jgi:hypothetical protein
MPDRLFWPCRPEPPVASQGQVASSTAWATLQKLRDAQVLAIHGVANATMGGRPAVVDAASERLGTERRGDFFGKVRAIQKDRRALQQRLADNFNHEPLSAILASNLQQARLARINVGK